MGLIRKVWKWGVILPAVLLAAGAVIGDASGQTLKFWPALLPLYAVMAVELWRYFDPARQKAMREADYSRKIAELDAEEAADAAAAGEPPPNHSHDDDGLDDDDDPEPLDLTAPDAIVARPSHNGAGKAVGGVLDLLFRLLITTASLFGAIVCVWLLISVATWARGLWFVWGPMALAALALGFAIIRAEFVGRKPKDALIR